jgi:Fur family ferric uptake transcriptional regulator
VRPTATAERLHRAGGRATVQRLLVADVLGEAGRKLSAGEVWQVLRRRQPGIGRATVFRALEALVEAGVARRLEMAGHVSGYVACQPEHHHHLACDRCGRVVEIPEAYVAPMASQITAELGFEVDDARLDFHGRCASCLAEGSRGDPDARTRRALDGS